MAAGAGSVRAGGAYVEFYADEAKLNASLVRTQARFRAWGSAISSMGSKLAMIGGGLLAGNLGAAAGIFESVFGKLSGLSGGAARLYDISQETGVSVEALSKLDYAAKLVGKDLSTVQGALRSLEKVMFDALVNPAGEGAWALARIGLNVRALLGRDMADNLLLVGESLKRFPAAGRMLAGKVLGDPSLLPFLQRLADGAGDAAEKLGLVTSSADARNAKEAAMAWSTLSMQFSKLWQAIGSALGPALKDLAKWIQVNIPPIQAWVKEHKSVIIASFAAAGGIAAMGLALKVLAPALSLAIGLGYAYLKWCVLMLVKHPLLTAAYYGGRAALLALAARTEYAGRAAAWLGKQWTFLKETAINAWGGIADALKAGDWALAAEIGVESIKLAWEGLADAFITDVIDPIRDGWARLWRELENAFSDLGKKGFWKSVPEAAKQFWQDVKGDIFGRPGGRQLLGPGGVVNRDQDIEDFADFTNKRKKFDESVDRERKAQREREHAARLAHIKELQDKLSGLRQTAAEKAARIGGPEGPAGLPGLPELATRMTVKGQFGGLGLGMLGGGTSEGLLRQQVAQNNTTNELLREISRRLSGGGGGILRLT